MQNAKKIISISIAAYNVEDTIERALKSLLHPSIVEDIEIFVVDDGGKDKSLQISKLYAEKYPNTVFPIHKENGGYGSTINSSIKRATGKYFKQLDGDDWFITENFVEFVGLLKTIEDDCVITEVADYRAGTNEQVVNEKFFDVKEGHHSFADTYLNFVLTMHGTTIRTDILQENNIRIIENCYYSDTELVVLPMPYMNTFYIWKKPLYVYLTGSEGQSMSLSGIKKHYQDHDKVFWELVAIYKKMKPEEVNKRELIFNRVKKEAVIHFKFLLRLDVNKQHFQELRIFGNRIRSEVPQLYEILLNERRMMRVMWNSKYLVYPLISGKVKKEYKQN